MRGQNRMVQLLKSQDYGRGRAKDALAGLFRTVLANLEVTPLEWERYVNNYLNLIQASGEDSTSSRSTLKGNVNKELSKDILAWKVFCKAFMVLGMDRVLFEIELHRLDTVSIHSYDNINRKKGAGEVLAEIFTRIRLDLGIGPLLWITLLNTFLKDPNLGLPDRGGERSAVKSRVEKDLNSPTMTWKMFLRGMKFIGVHQMALKVICFKDGEETSHRIVVKNVCDKVSFQKRLEEVTAQQEERFKTMQLPNAESGDE